MNSKERSNDTIEIDLRALMRFYLKRWWIFVIVVVAAAVIGYVGTHILIAPTYQSSVQIYVQNTQIDNNSSSSSVSTSDLNASTQLVDLYTTLLVTDNTLDRIIEQTGLTCTYDELKDMITTEAVNDTQVFMVTVTNESPEEAQLIAETIGEVLPDVITELIPEADAVVVSDAKVPDARSGPSYTRNAVMAALIGFVIVAIVLLIVMLADTTIRSEKDVLDIADFPILGHLPDIEEMESRKSHYSHYYYGSSKKADL